ncbi:hypothetical protein AB0J06_22290, partial [Micromonospora sp. NPDC049679]
TPSADWSRIRLLRIVKLVIGPSIQAPTLLCCTRARADGAADAASTDDADSAGKTHLGLPVRVRQARLAPGLREAVAPAPVDQPLRPARSPEEIRQMMSAYQSGTARGRQQVTDDADLPSTPDTTNPATAEHADEEN